MIYILVGEMGVGKNHIGERLASYLGCGFFDGDSVIPKPMADRINKFKLLPPPMIEDYIRNYLIPGIRRRNFPGKDLVVAQALYRKKFRDQVVKAFDQVQLIHVVPPSFSIHMGRLLKRNNGAKWIAFCLVNKLFFQRPGKEALSIVSGREIDERIRLLI